MTDENWEKLVKEYEPLIGKKFTNKKGSAYELRGLLHGKDDYYYVMEYMFSIGCKTENIISRYLSCALTLEQHGFVLAKEELYEDFMPSILEKSPLEY